jgi:hypothetical protein
MLMDIDMSELAVELWSFFCEYTNSLDVIARNRNVLLAVKADCREESLLPHDFPGCEQQRQQLGLRA